MIRAVVDHANYLLSTHIVQIGQNQRMVLGRAQTDNLLVGSLEAHVQLLWLNSSGLLAVAQSTTDPMAHRVHVTGVGQEQGMICTQCRRLNRHAIPLEVLDAPGDLCALFQVQSQVVVAVRAKCKSLCVGPPVSIIRDPGLGIRIREEFCGTPKIIPITDSGLFCWSDSNAKDSGTRRHTRLCGLRAAAERLPI